MHKKSINEIKEEYELDLDAISKEIKKLEDNSIILFQFPDGMKPYSTTIVDYFKEKFPSSTFLIWMESCFGACDVPVIGSQLEKEIDLVVQFGHVAWHNNSPIWEG